MMHNLNNFIYFLKANCTSIDNDDHDKKLESSQVQSYLEKRDSFLNEENSSPVHVFSDSSISEEIINQRLSNLSFIERYNLYFGPKLIFSDLFESTSFHISVYLMKILMKAIFLDMVHICFLPHLPFIMQINVHLKFLLNLLRGIDLLLGLLHYLLR